MVDQDAVVFAQELVEADGAAHGKRKKSGDVAFTKRKSPGKGCKNKALKNKFWSKKDQSTSLGRVLVIKGRESKKVVVKPLKSKPFKKGGPGAGETAEEFLPHFWKHLKADSLIACSDAGSGLGKAWKRLGIPAATAKHSIDEMTPLRSFKVKDLTSGQKKTAQMLAAKKRPAALFSPKKRKVTVVGGDNSAESEVARGKQQLRRINRLGRSSPANNHIDLLAARRLLLKPGLMTVLKALESLEIYRLHRLGSLGRHPETAFSQEDADFLFS